MPPPRDSELPLSLLFALTVLLLTVNDPLLKMPPPSPFTKGSPLGLPLLIVIPSSVAVTPLLIKNTLDKLLPLIDNRPAPGPWIVRFLSITSWPDVRVIVCEVAKMSGPKLIVPPAATSAIACRRLPAPLSFVLVTVIVAALAVISFPSPENVGSRSPGAAIVIWLKVKKKITRPRESSVKVLCLFMGKSPLFPTVRQQDPCLCRYREQKSTVTSLPGSVGGADPSRKFTGPRTWLAPARSARLVPLLRPRA